ncbi:hypothetical protein D3C78_1109130 [compost metagenome]
MINARATVPSRNSAETIFIGRSMRAAKRGAKWRTSIPRHTGTRTMANTCKTLANCRGMAWSADMKYSSDRLTTNGMLSIAITELTAVRVTLSATSP